MIQQRSVERMSFVTSTPRVPGGGGGDGTLDVQYARVGFIINYFNFIFSPTP